MIYDTERAGLSYPSTEGLQQVIALYLARGAFLTGQELEEPSAPWESARSRTLWHTVPFDQRWFAALPRAERAASPTVLDQQ